MNLQTGLALLWRLAMMDLGGLLLGPPHDDSC